MSIELVQDRLLGYKATDAVEQENALKEIAQEIALLSLSRAGFFRVAAFQGGTCLRILYNLRRFSEDLDFILKEPNPEFDWSDYISAMHEEFLAYGYELRVTHKNKLEKTVKIAFLKGNSQGGLLSLNETGSTKTLMKIKFEVDTNPPAGSAFDIQYLDFPLAFSIHTQDIPSLFAGKIHALLQRPFVKGRDWYDFSWYLARRADINYVFLKNALAQSMQTVPDVVDKNWVLDALTQKIKSIDWAHAKLDVKKFLRPMELRSLEVWGEPFFLSRVEKLAEYLHGTA